MRRAATLALWLGAAACGREELVRAEGVLLVPAKLELPAWVGHEAGASLELRNGGRAPLHVELEVDAPFRVEPAQVALLPGGKRAVSLSVRSDAAGRVEATVRYLGHDAQTAVRSDVQEPPICEPAAACTSTRFNPTRGACMQVPLPDGTPCDGGLCLEEAHCIAGRCFGKGVQCDDGDPCTADACESTRGCVDMGPLSACRTPANPCLAPICHPAAGCATSPVADGTACAVTPSRAGLCLAGSCEPDDSPSRCERACWEGCTAEAPPTQPVWTYTPPAGNGIVFPGIVDEDGVLYWKEGRWEGDGSSCVLVAMGIDGKERYRAETRCASKHSAHDEQVLLSQGRLIALQPGGIIAHATRDGTLAWHYEPAAVAGCERSLEWMAASEALLVVSYEERCSDSDDGWGVVALDPVGGEPRLRYEERLAQIERLGPLGIVVDESGNSYVQGGEPRGRITNEIVSLDQSLEVRWRVPSTGSVLFPFAIAGKALFTVPAIGRDADSGGISGPSFHHGTTQKTFSLPTALGPSLLGDGDGRWFNLDLDWDRALMAYEERGTRDWEVPLCSLGVCAPHPDMVLTDRQSLLLRATDRTWPDPAVPPVTDGRMLEISGDDGSVLRHCRLEQAPHFQHGLPILRDGLYVVLVGERSYDTEGIAAYAIPGIDESPTGWAGAGGGSTRRGAER